MPSVRFNQCIHHPKNRSIRSGFYRLAGRMHEHKHCSYLQNTEPFFIPLALWLVFLQRYPRFILISMLNQRDSVCLVLNGNVDHFLIDHRNRIPQAQTQLIYGLHLIRTNLIHVHFIYPWTRYIIAFKRSFDLGCSQMSGVGPPQTPSSRFMNAIPSVTIVRSLPCFVS